MDLKNLKKGDYVKHKDLGPGFIIEISYSRQNVKVQTLTRTVVVKNRNHIEPSTREVFNAELEAYHQRINHRRKHPASV